jgi:hypothetical protein
MVCIKFSLRDANIHNHCPKNYAISSVRGLYEVVTRYRLSYLSVLSLASELELPIYTTALQKLWDNLQTVMHAGQSLVTILSGQRVFIKYRL